MSDLSDESESKEKKKAKYEDSSQLQELATQILLANPPELEDAHDFKWKIFFTNKETTHYAAQCRKIDGAVRFKTGLDFVIVVNKDEFEKVRPEEKARIVIHGLYHISSGEGDELTLVLRKHDGDFCEIPSHDTFSREIFEKIKDQLTVLGKMPFQTTLEEKQVV